MGRSPSSYGPAQPDSIEWKKLSTIVWCNLPDVAEQTLLPVLLSHAEKHAGHIGIAKAKKNLGLRVPWASVATARAALRPQDHAITEENRALRDDKSFRISGIPRGALSSEVVAACKQMSWSIIAQARLPAKQGKSDEWWVSAAAPPPKRQFLWNEQHIIITDSSEDDIRRARNLPRESPASRSAQLSKTLAMILCRVKIPGKGSSQHSRPLLQAAIPHPALLCHEPLWAVL